MSTDADVSDPRASQHVSPAECRAMRILARDGWTAGELRMTFMVSYEGVRLHARGDCCHAVTEPGADELASGGSSA